MKRKGFCAVLVFAVVMIALVGCKGSKNPESTASNGVQVQGQAGEQPTAVQPPHQFGDFKGAGFNFTGGQAVTGYNLSGIRRVSHPQLVRLVFQFTEGESGNPGSLPPGYQIEMENQKIIMRLKGVDRADVLDSKKEILALSSVIKDITFTKVGSNDGELSLILNNQVSFQVFDLAQPARIVVVLNPEQTKSQEL